MNPLDLPDPPWMTGPAAEPDPIDLAGATDGKGRKVREATWIRGEDGNTYLKLVWDDGSVSRLFGLGRPSLLLGGKPIAYNHLSMKIETVAPWGHEWSTGVYDPKSVEMTVEIIERPKEPPR
jgi:hypothetical protein